jgi:hypothetical protein
MPDNRNVALILIYDIVCIRLEESKKTIRMVASPVFGPRFDLLTSNTKHESDRTPVSSTKAEVHWSNTYLARCTFSTPGLVGVEGILQFLRRRRLTEDCYCVYDCIISTNTSTSRK